MRNKQDSLVGLSNRAEVARKRAAANRIRLAALHLQEVIDSNEDHGGFDLAEKVEDISRPLMELLNESTKYVAKGNRSLRESDEQH